MCRCVDAGLVSGRLVVHVRGRVSRRRCATETVVLGTRAAVFPKLNSTNDGGVDTGLDILPNGDHTVQHKLRTSPMHVLIQLCKGTRGAQAQRGMGDAGNVTHRKALAHVQAAPPRTQPRSQQARCPAYIPVGIFELPSPARVASAFSIGSARRT